MLLKKKPLLKHVSCFEEVIYTGGKNPPFKNVNSTYTAHLLSQELFKHVFKCFV